MEQLLFKDGNILSLTLTNFQTFKNTTMSFSPTLNFIIGPNGSGKSTISNALSFIFGGNTKTIGKAKQLKEYIRFGEEKCKIEAKIYFNKEIVTLTRSMSHTSNTFYINQTAVKKNSYNEFIQKLKININNLCQYLPQERVSEFSRMSPEELLVQTCFSLDKSSLIDGLNEVKEIERMKSEVSSKENVMNTEKNNLKNVVDTIHRDIEKIKERENKKLRVEMMETKKVWLEYENMRSDYKRLTNGLRMLKKSLTNNTMESEEVRQKIEVIKKSPLNVEMLEKVRRFDLWDCRLKEKVEELKQKKNKEVYLEADLENLERRKEKNKEDVKKLTEEIDKIVEDLEREKKEIRDKLKEVKVLKVKCSGRDGCKMKKIPDKNEVLEQVMRHFDGEKEANIDSYLLEYDTATIDEQESRLFELRRMRNDLQDLCLEKKTRFDEIEEKKKKINEEGERRLELLKRYHQDTYNAVVWYRENKSLFSKEIIEPTFLHLNIKNEKFTAEIEGFLSFTLMTSFICKDSKDFVKFMKKVKDEKGLRINAVEEIKQVERSNFTTDQFRQLGFEGCILDFIEVREETRNFLIAHGHFDSIPLTKTRLDERRIFEGTTIKRFAMDSKYFDIKRSRYNEKDYVVNSSRITPKNLFSMKIDTSEIENQLRLLSAEREKHSGELKIIYTDILELEDALKKRIAKKNEHDKELGLVKRKITVFNITLNTLKQKKEKLETLKDLRELNLKKEKIDVDLEMTRQEKVNIKNQMIEILRDQEYIRLFQECMMTYKDIQSEFKTLDFLENNFQLLTKSVKELTTQVEEQEELKKEMQNVMNENKKKLKEMETKALNTQDTCPVMVSEEMRLLPNTVEELNIEITKEKTQLKFINVNEEVRDEYEDKKKQLDQISTELEATTSNRRKFEERAKSIRTMLIKSLTDLTEKINTHFQELFSQLGCEGRLEFVCRNGASELPCKNWRLNILVKFREKEKLEVLSSFRQSGGEKSVSTILFLLALQKVDSAPFRLVDEINQGMDRHNETSVLNILFEMCKNEKSTQFFIISPKLVNGLAYNECIRVIILFSDQPGAVKKAFLKGKN